MRAILLLLLLPLFTPVASATCVGPACVEVDRQDPRIDACATLDPRPGAADPVEGAACVAWDPDGRDDVTHTESVSTGPLHECAAFVACARVDPADMSVSECAFGGVGVPVGAIAYAAQCAEADADDAEPLQHAFEAGAVAIDPFARTWGERGPCLIVHEAGARGEGGFGAPTAQAGAYDREACLDMATFEFYEGASHAIFYAALVDDDGDGQGDRLVTGGDMDPWIAVITCQSLETPGHPAGTSGFVCVFMPMGHPEALVYLLNAGVYVIWPPGSVPDAEDPTHVCPEFQRRGVRADGGLGAPAHLEPTEGSFRRCLT